LITAAFAAEYGPASAEPVNPPSEATVSIAWRFS